MHKLEVLRCDARFRFPEVNNEMQIGLRISIRSTSEITEGKYLERDLQTYINMTGSFVLF